MEIKWCARLSGDRRCWHAGTVRRENRRLAKRGFRVEGERDGKRFQESQCRDNRRVSITRLRLFLFDGGEKMYSYTFWSRKNSYIFLIMPYLFIF